MSRQCSGVMASDLKKGKMVQKTETWRTFTAAFFLPINEKARCHDFTQIVILVI